MTQLIDVHAHLETLKDLKIILLRAKEAGVSKIITCGSSIEWSRKCVDLAENGSNLVEIYACCGIHPQDGKEELESLGSGYIDQLRQLVDSSKKVVAIGECGLDYGLKTDNGQMTTDEKEFQKRLFQEQVNLASELKLPIVIHCRNAWSDLLDILSDVSGQMSVVRGMFHSWTGSLNDAKRAIALGFYISFSGILTFKNAGEIVDVAKWAPEDRILVETDTPFLTPIPLRGKQNEPKNVRITVQFLAELRGKSLDTIAEATTRNAENLFNLENSKH